jgi:type II secretory pathway component PulF
MPRALRLAGCGENKEFSFVRSIRDKREFYSHLAQLMRSGSALPTALDLLARDASSSMARFLGALRDRLNAGAPLGEAILSQHVTAMESSIIAAAERSGHLDRGCEQLARYFGALVKARGEVWKRMLYPLVMLHVCVLMMKVSLFFTASAAAFLIAVLKPLAEIYLIVGAVWLWWFILNEAARTNAAADTFLSLIPGLGGVRRKFALARFFATLDTQLDAAVNIWDAFANAARASDSARIVAGARAAMPELQRGEKLSEALSRHKVIPVEQLRAFRVAEQTGSLVEQLTDLAQRAEAEAVATLDRWAEWLPRILYALVLFYCGWQIVSYYAGYMQTVEKTIDM